jgi:hypothetical protein
MEAESAAAVCLRGVRRKRRVEHMIRRRSGAADQNSSGAGRPERGSPHPRSSAFPAPLLMTGVYAVPASTTYPSALTKH